MSEEKQGKGKAKENAQAAETPQPVVYTADQQKLIAAFTVEERKEFDSLSSDAKRQEVLSLLAAITNDTSAKARNDFERVATTTEHEEITILEAGGMLLRAGTVLIAEFLGTMPMFSYKFKENWADMKDPNGDTFWVNHFYVFRNIKTGLKFGIYKSPMLNKILPKLPTHEATPGLVAKNPVVRLEYVGKVEGREKLKELYDLELTKGSSAHVYLVDVEKGLTYDIYAQGVVNYLKSPIPTLGEKEEVKGADRLARDWERLERLNGRAPATAPVSHQVAQ